MPRFPTNVVQDAKFILQDISPELSGNTKYNAIITYPTHEGFNGVLLESISRYGVALNNAEGGWGGKRNRKTGRILDHWFDGQGKNAVLDYIRGVGGYKNNMNATRFNVLVNAQDNPLRQKTYIQQISESGDASVDITE